MFVNKIEEKMEFAEHLQILRKQAGISQVALAKEIHISWRAYQTYERGEREPGDVHADRSGGFLWD